MRFLNPRLMSLSMNSQQVNFRLKHSTQKFEMKHYTQTENETLHSKQRDDVNVCNAGYLDLLQEAV